MEDQANSTVEDSCPPARSEDELTGTQADPSILLASDDATWIAERERKLDQLPSHGSEVADTNEYHPSLTPAPSQNIIGSQQTVDLEADVQSRQAQDDVAAQVPERNWQLKGGTYSETEALDSLNRSFFIGETENDIGIYRINEDGSATFIPEKDFKLLLANVTVQRSSGGPVNGTKFWLTQPRRAERKIIFNPQQTRSGEHNLWRGFAVKPIEGWDKQWHLLRHIYKVICRRDRRKFWYLMRWLAWAVQHPDEAPGTLVMLKSRAQGTGKSTLGVVMCDIFGRHGRRIDDKEQLLGRFNDELETTCFILAEEILWAGDSRTADKLKSRITSDIIPVEAKYRTRREVKNRMHVMMTTNHEHAVPAGARDRRFFVLDVSDEHAQDAAWFGRLYQDLADGGKEQFLALLLNLELGDFHPRALVKTDEAYEQQRMSGDSISQWSQACIEADEIIGPAGYSMPARSSLDCDCSFEELRQSHSWYCQQHKLHPASTNTFGRALAGMFGPRKRLTVARSNRPWGYKVPKGDKWQECLDERLGVRN